MLQIKIAGVKRGSRQNVLASIQVELLSEDGQDTVSVLDARVLRNKNGQLWVGYPNQAFPDPEGAIRYVPILSFSKDLTRRVSDTVLVAYENNLRMQPQPSKMTPQDFGTLSGGNDGR